MQISKYAISNSHYPELLREINSAPKHLYVLGNLPKDIPYLAIVGTRHPSIYGEQVTYRLARELASAGVVIVSGLALGVDAIAHQAAIEAGGITVGVLATGLDEITPPSHRGLAKRILASGGALVSENPAGSPIHKGSFPLRNRIIAGLCQGALITEASAKSGSLHTAKATINENRILMAVPGPITSELSAGSNNLLKSGAITVTDSSDVMAALGYQSTATANIPRRPQNADEAEIMRLILEGHNTTASLIEASTMNASEFAGVITLMEISGKVRNIGAGQWIVR